MKKIFNKIALLLLITLTLNSCKEPDNVIYDVFDGISHGAILRTLDDGSQRTFSISDLNSAYVVEFEEQDEQYGDLLDKVDVYVQFLDKTPGGTDNSKSEVLLTSFPKSSFTTSASGLPKNTLNTTFGDVLNALSLNPGQYDGGDQFVFRLELVLTDGRTFSADDTSGSLQGSYFKSPYAYSATIVCPPVPGTYTVNMHDSYGDGWQTDTASGGSGIKVTVDGTLIAEVGMCSPYVAATYACTPWPANIADPTADFHDATATVTLPAGVETKDVVWMFPGDAYGEISFEIVGPNSGTNVFVGALAATPAGPLAINYCNE